MPKETVFPTKTEGIIGICYALFCAVLLPWILNFIFSVVGLSLSSSILNLLYFVVNFLVVVICFRKFLLKTGKAFLDHTQWTLLIAVLGFVVYTIASQGIGRLILWLKPDFYNLNDQGIAALAGNYYIPTLICTVFLVPLTEECLYRGAIFGTLLQKNAIAAYAISAIVFSLVHIDGLIGVADWPVLGLSFLQYLPAGLCLAAAYHLSGSIVAPILIHMAVNAIGIFALR